MDTITNLVKVEHVYSRCSGATCLSCVTASTYTQFSEDFWVWLHKPEMVTMVIH